MVLVAYSLADDLLRYRYTHREEADLSTSTANALLFASYYVIVLSGDDPW